MASGSAPTRSGAARAITASAATSTAPMKLGRRRSAGRRPASPLTPALSTETGVEEAIADIHTQVEEHDRGPADEKNALQERIVALGDRAQHEAAHAGQREDLLDHDGPAEQVAELEPDEGDDRDERVPQRVVADYAALAEALGPRGPHVVLGEDLQHAAPRHPHHHGSEGQTE